jgi:signal transduction histidine kinase
LNKLKRKLFFIQLIRFIYGGTKFIGLDYGTRLNVKFYNLLILIVILSFIIWFFILYYLIHLILWHYIVVVAFLLLSLMAIRKGHILLGKSIGCQTILTWITYMCISLGVRSSVHYYSIIIFYLVVFFLLKDKKSIRVYIFFLIQSLIIFLFFEFFGYKFNSIQTLDNYSYTVLQLMSLFDPINLFLIFILIIKNFSYFNIYNSNILINKNLKKKEILNTIYLDINNLGIATSHSIKTPIFVITSCLRKMTQIKNYNKDEYERYISLIKESKVIINKYSQGLLNYNQILEKREVDKWDINLKEKVDEWCELLRKNQLTHQITNEVEEINICTNPDLLELIIINLVENGLKYNQSKNPTVHIFTKTIQSQLVIYISDNGIGVNEAYKDKIFSPFTRINVLAVEGTGLGLASVKMASKKLGIIVSLEYSSPKGSIFSLKFT